MVHPPGSKPGMSSCTLPSPYICNSPQISSHTRTKYADLAESSRRQPFKASAWLMYDRAFRYMAASNTAMAWAKVNKQLYNDILKEETLPYCINCNAYGHRTLACSMRSKSAQSFRPYSATSTTTGQSHTLISTSIQPTPTQPLQQGAICSDFNCRAPIVNLGTSAINQIVEETTLAPSTLKYLPCNPTPLRLSLPSTPVNNSSITLISNTPHASSNGVATLATLDLALLG